MSSPPTLSAGNHDKQPLLYKEKTPMLNYTKRYDQVSWRSADTDFEIDPSASSADESNRTRVKTALPNLCTKRRRKLTALVIVILVFLIIMSGLIYLYYSKPGALDVDETEEVQTDGGAVIGMIESFEENGEEIKSYTFKGIPYAKPPIANLRFSPPVPLAKSNGNSWEGTYKAIQYGSQCVQQSPAGSIEGSENCLFLNVYSPLLDKNANLPVFVWIYGGSLMTGNANIPGYGPDAEFTTSMNVVSVSMNYRVNAFGFLTLKELWEEGESYGNYGIMDQILVLKWIKKNIKNFGGNPNRVTICGQSSGGTSIFALLVSPLADGLFNNIISMSGSPRFYKSYVEASEDNKVLLNQTRCANESSATIKECLLNLTATDITHAIPYDVYPAWKTDGMGDFPTKGQFFGMLPVIEPIVMPKAPKDIKDIKFKNSDKISILLGSTAQEIEFTSLLNFTSKTLDDVKVFLKKRLDAFSLTYYSSVVDQKYKSLFETSNNYTGKYVYETISTDVRVTCPSNSLLEDFTRSEKHSTAFRYIVTNCPQNPVNLIFGPIKQYENSFHVWDAAALFGFKLLKNYTPNSKDNLFKKTIRDNFKHFIYFGHLVSSDWGKGKTGIFNNNGTIDVLTENYQNDKCDLWKSFNEYAWIN